MQKKNFFILFCIIILGFLLRYWHINKPEGLWNDEYIGWMISSKPLISPFLQEAVKNCHMPLYYLYLKLWMFIGTDSDLSLRFSSLFWGVLSIISMYFAGKEYKDEKTGLLCALFAALSGFLIYFSQEVRLYQMLFFITSLNLLSWLKLSAKQNKANFILFGVTNLLIILTHTIGFVFVFFNILYLSVYLAKIDKKFIKMMWMTIAGICTLLIPLVPFIYNVFKESYVSQFWSGFSVGKLFFTAADYFSPIQINIINTPKYITDILAPGGHLNYIYLLFALIPSIICSIGLLKTFFIKDKRIKYLWLTLISFFIVLIIAAYFNKLVLSTKYSVEIYPGLILLICSGILSFKSKTLKTLLITLLTLLPLCFYGINKNSTPKLGRPEGNLIVAQLLKQAKIRPSDKILLTYYDETRFAKYINTSNYKFYSINKYNFPEYIVPQKYSYKTIVINGKILFYDNLKNDDKKLFNEKFYNMLLMDMEKGDKLAIVLLKSVSFYNAKQLKIVTANHKTYYNTPFLFMVFSFIKNSAFEICNKYLKLKSAYESGDWVIVVYEKQ